MARSLLCSVTVLLLLGCGIPTAITAAVVDSKISQNYVNMSAICSLVPNGEYVADTENCNYYYSCNNGVATIKYCYDNYYFDKNSQQCLPQNQVTCYSHNVNPCQGRTVGSWVSVPGTCGSYYYCSNDGPNLGNCPQGENFNPYDQACQYPSSYACSNYGTDDSLDNSDNVNLCAYIQDGIYFGSPSSCQGWYMCNNGALKSGNCPVGYMYSVQQSACVSSTDSSCQQLSSSPYVVQNDPYYGGPCSQSDNPTIAANSCQNYYTCNGANYTLNTCSNDLYFDTVSTACVSRLNARNKCDRCQGTNLSFVNTYSTSTCAGYAYCVNGVQKNTGTCPTGSYFNEVYGACVVNEDPDFGCCNPALYYGSPEQEPASNEA